MSPKIDVREIVTDHFRTLRDAPTGKVSIADLFTFFVVPALLGIAYFVVFKNGFGNNGVSILVGALSILAGLLINVLVLLYTVNAVGDTDEETREQIAYIREVNANLLYGICTAILVILILCIELVFPRQPARILSAFGLALLTHFLLTLLMTLKRIKVLVDLRFKNR